MSRDRSGGGGGGGKAGGDEEAPLTVQVRWVVCSILPYHGHRLTLTARFTHTCTHGNAQERAALLEMGVVRDGEVFFLEQGDIEGALRAFEGKEAEEATEE